NRPAPDNFGKERLKDLHLRRRIGMVEGPVPGVLQLDPYGAAINVLLALPEAHSRMPGAPILSYKSIERAILIDQVMRGNLGFCIAQPLKRVLRMAHPGIMQHDHVDRLPRGSIFGIGRRAGDGIEHGFFHRRGPSSRRDSSWSQRSSALANSARAGSKRLIAASNPGGS